MEAEAIIDRYYRKIYKLCLFYLNNAEEAEELLQEIFFKILKKQKTFKGKSSIYTWIYRIAVNTLINYINRKKIVEFVSLEAVNEFGGTDNPALRLEREELESLRIQQLEQCVRLLSNREKTAFYFFHYDDLKQKEIAEIMNTSVSAVESLVHKAMKKIRRCMTDD